ncbi:radical SAM protein [Desulfatibacillum aliphaticivorans]|uniref:radical SAM protein n=1 Tax=Desulfatibacillum aliphaticivorans TaxID=218208 RepID=UPI00041B23EB|nr:radical SAM protein [Desulfatibacillum aliphaticivorans]
MKIIYEPKGAAREYAPLACNLYTTCPHGCLYCYAPGATRKAREAFNQPAQLKKNALERLEHDAARVEAKGDDREILLSFIGDPYPWMGGEATREAIKILIHHKLRFTVLTKGGLRAIKDFHLLKGYDKCSFGTSLVWIKQGSVNRWEPFAATVKSRIAAIKTAKAMGIKTWISLEPVIDPAQALAVIRATHKYVDHYKVGKINHDKERESRIHWHDFRRELGMLCLELDVDYTEKKSLRNI